MQIEEKGITVNRGKGSWVTNFNWGTGWFPTIFCWKKMEAHKQCNVHIVSVKSWIEDEISIKADLKI